MHTKRSRVAFFMPFFLCKELKTSPCVTWSYFFFLKQSHHNNASHQQPTGSSGRRQPRKQSLSEISAQDLLEKSHEELVLMLIHLRRQTTALTEAIDGSRAELGHMEKALASYGGRSEVALMMMGGSGSGGSSEWDFAAF